MTISAPDDGESCAALSSCRRGVAGAEFALILPLLLLILFGSIQYGALVYTRNSMQTIARNGARALAAGNVTADEVVATARATMPGWVPPAEVEVTAGPSGADNVRVAISVPAASATVVRFAPMPDMISAEVVMRRETLGVGN